MHSALRLALAFSLAAASAVGYAQTVVEYSNQRDFFRAPGGQFFYSADPSEQAFVDSGGAGTFKRTGGGFIAGGKEPLCRFYGSVAPGPNSHFYTILPDECSALKSQQISPKPSATQQWNFEGNGYSATAATKDATGKQICAAGLQPVYRVYNQAFTTAGNKNAWDSNHRYSTRRGDIDYLVQALNWKDEGVVFCAAGQTPEPSYPKASVLEKQCNAPRADAKYGDKPGSINTEIAWVQSYADEKYLWYDALPYTSTSFFSTPALFFDMQKTYAKTPSGRDLDEFHYRLPTTEWESFVNSEAGVGYGLDVASAAEAGGSRAVVRLVEPGSPAGLAGVTRSMEIISANGNASASAITGALNPRAAGQSSRFEFFVPATGGTLNITLVAAAVKSVPVLATKVLPTANGNVGYIVFNDFTLAAEGQLVTAIDTLRSANVNDLVLDLRYNGGGYLYIAAQLSYMIAGAKSSGKLFEKTIFNAKRIAENNDPDNDTPFFNVASGYPGTGTVENTRLPTLNLNRVYVLTSGGSASASEAVINGLRGIDVEVIVIGTTTRGKPYGFYGEDNCGLTYLTVEFKGINAKGYGDFADGFAPTCTVSKDDLSKDFGDLAETRLATALAHRATGTCPAGTTLTNDNAKAANALSPTRAARVVTGGIRLPREIERALLEANKRSALQP